MVVYRVVYRKFTQRSFDPYGVKQISRVTYFRIGGIWSTCHHQCVSLRWYSSQVLATTNSINGLFFAAACMIEWLTSFLRLFDFLLSAHTPQLNMTMSTVCGILLCAGLNVIRASCSRRRNVLGNREVSFESWSDGLVGFAFQTWALKEGQATSLKLVFACYRRFSHRHLQGYPVLWLRTQILIFMVKWWPWIVRHN